jgi:protein-S-isoprenylcysteine O-methyltransferase Ste14
MADVAAALARSRVPLGFVCGAGVLWLSHPTFTSLALGGAVAGIGEIIRWWAAGHLEKGKEVTRSGPYRFTRHPLYLGSALIGAGVAIASRQWAAAALVVAYLASTLIAAMRHEEANMRAAFGSRYDTYITSDGDAVQRPFSLARAIKNREHRTVIGLLAVAAVFALKASRHL